MEKGHDGLEHEMRSVGEPGTPKPEESVHGPGAVGQSGTVDPTGSTVPSGSAALPRTVKEALQIGTQALVGRFESQGASDAELEQSARNEADWLMQWATGWNRTALLLSLQDPVSNDAWTKFWRAVERRVNGEPLQYIVGEAPFYGRWFHVEPGCLIPRPETELLAEAAITYIKRDPKGARVVDIGTGSGALAVTIALECTSADVWAVDLSPDAIRIATGNAEQLGAEVSFVHQDAIKWLEDVKRGNPVVGVTKAENQSHGAATSADETSVNETSANASVANQTAGLRIGENRDGELNQRIQVLVSNPPYIPSEDIRSLDTDVRDYEPRLALDGGDDGLDFYRSLAGLGQGIFAEGPAALFLEVGMGQAPDVRDLFTADDADFDGWTFELLKDLRGIERIVKGVRE